jgi:hypothetical protein
MGSKSEGPTCTNGSRSATFDNATIIYFSAKQASLISLQPVFPLPNVIMLNVIMLNVVVPIIFKGVNIIVIFDQRICQTFAKIA